MTRDILQLSTRNSTEFTSFIFTHDLVRETAASLWPKSQLMTLHGLLASHLQAVQRSLAVPPHDAIEQQDRIMYHLSEAGDSSALFEGAMSGAEVALRMRAYGSACRYLLTAEQHQATLRQKARVHTMMATTRLRLGEFAAAEHRARSALRLLRMRSTMITDGGRFLRVLRLFGFATVSTFLGRPNTQELSKLATPPPATQSQQVGAVDYDFALQVQAGIVMAVTFAAQGHSSKATATALQQLRACEQHLARLGVTSQAVAALATECCAWGLLWTHAIGARRMREHYRRLGNSCRSHLTQPGGSSAASNFLFSEAMVSLATGESSEARRCIATASRCCPADDAALKAKLLCLQAVAHAEDADEEGAYRALDALAVLLQTCTMEEAQPAARQARAWATAMSLLSLDDYSNVRWTIIEAAIADSIRGDASIDSPDAAGSAAIADVSLESSLWKVGVQAACIVSLCCR